ncbi:MAG: TIGR03545 family protein [bacterium]|nr:TIGR03545 family protein [bacterium]MDD5354487.1 TIGR03545 family protein [bacterium]
MIKFRKSSLLIFFVVLAIFIVVGIIFRDAILKQAFISTGEMVTGAKIEVSSFKTSLMDSSLEIKDLQVANKSDVWKNLVVIDLLKFDMRFLPLLTKKVAIENMTVSNLRWGTTRKTSGALPPRKQKKYAKQQANEKKAGLTDKIFIILKDKITSESKALPIVQDIQNISDTIKNFDAKQMVSAENLQSRAAVEGLYNNSVVKYEQYKTDANTLNVEQKVADTKQVIQDVQGLKVNSVADIPKVKEAITKLNNQKKVIEETYGKVTTLKNDITTQFADSKALTLQIDDLVKADYQNLLAKVKIPGLGEKGGLAKAIFGQMWFDRVNSVMGYISLARKYMPAKKKTDNVNVKPRAKGMDIEFRKDETLPTFSVRKIALSGTTGGEGKNVESPITVAGGVNNVSSDQKVWGKPTSFDAKGEASGRKYLIDGLFDHTAEIATDQVNIKASNFPIGEMSLDSKGFLPKFKHGKYDITSQFKLTGDDLDCRLQLKIYGIAFEIEPSTNDLKQILNEVFASIQEIDLQAHMYSQAGDFQTAIESNLDNLIAEKIKAIYGRKMEELKAKVKAELETRIQAEKEKLLKLANEKKAELLAQVNAKLAAVQGQKDGLTKQVEDYTKQIAGSQAAPVKEAEENIKNKASDSLKKLFGK